MFSRHRGLIILMVVLCAEALALAYQVHKDRDIPMVRRWPILLVSPVGKGLRAISGGTWSLWRNYFDLRGARRENELLHHQLDDTKAENQRLETDAAEARRLRALLQFKQQLASETVAAQVIGSGGSETARLVLLDKGQEAGLRPDMAVIVPEGIVGKVLRVFPYSAQALLLTDPNSGVASLLENSRVHGILKGQNRTLANLSYVPNDDKVQIGERVITSGEDRIYPKGLPVGVVVEAHAGPSFQEIQVQPFAKLNRLEEVLVITKKVDMDLPEPPATEAPAGASPAVSQTQPGTGAAVKPGEKPAMPSARPQQSAASNPKPDASLTARPLPDASAPPAPPAAGTAPKPVQRPSRDRENAPPAPSNAPPSPPIQ